MNSSGPQAVGTGEREEPYVTREGLGGGWPGPGPCTGFPTLSSWGESVVPHAHNCPQLFITVMDKLRLEIRAMDEVQLPGGVGLCGAGWPGLGSGRGAGSHGALCLDSA